MTSSYIESTLSSILLYVARELENLLLPDAQTLQVGVERKLIVNIDIESSSKIEYNSTAGRGGAYIGVIYIGVIPIPGGASRSVISTGVITIHYICIGDGDGAGRSNYEDADDSIF